MSLTNFAALTTEQKTVWAKKFWRAARERSFVPKFMGKSFNSPIQRITELKKTEKGARAVITLVGETEGDGVAGDNTLEGNEDPIKSYDQVIQIDQLRNAHRHKGKMADQKSVVNFREEAYDNLTYWMGDRLDQIAFLTLSGVSLAFNTDGSARSADSAFPELEYAADITAPTANRHFRWNSAAGTLDAGNTANVAAVDTPSYKLLVLLKAKAKTTKMRGIKGNGGEEAYHVFLHPLAMAKLRLDSDFLANMRNAGLRGPKNELFKGADSVVVDGLVVHEYLHVYNTLGTATKWGAGNAIDGCRMLFVGAQALGFGDIGTAEWIEKGFDYENQQGISVGKIFGFKKPVFYSAYTKTNEDFGVICVDVAL